MQNDESTRHVPLVPGYDLQMQASCTTENCSNFRVRLYTESRVWRQGSKEPSSLWKYIDLDIPSSSSWPTLQANIGAAAGRVPSLDGTAEISKYSGRFFLAGMESAFFIRRLTAGQLELSFLWTNRSHQSYCETLSACIWERMMKAEPLYLPSCYYQYYLLSRQLRLRHEILYLHFNARDFSCYSQRERPAGEWCGTHHGFSIVSFPHGVDWNSNRQELFRLLNWKICYQPYIPTRQEDIWTRTLRASCDHLVKSWELGFKVTLH